LILHSIPHLREFFASTTLRMGIPPLVLPLARVENTPLELKN
jgi:hypothetical protein